MRSPALLACLLVAAVAGSPAFAQTESYEADSGLITMGGFVVFFNSEGPLSYATLTARNLPPGAVLMGEVKGRGCQYGVATPIIALPSVPRMSGAGGRGGYDKALRDIRERHPELKGIYDVKVDDHVVAVLTVYQRQCTEITARGFK